MSAADQRSLGTSATEQRPAFRFAQNSAMSAAPGNMPDTPTTAMSEDETGAAALIGAGSLCTVDSSNRAAAPSPFGSSCAAGTAGAPASAMCAASAFTLL